MKKTIFYSLTLALMAFGCAEKTSESGATTMADSAAAPATIVDDANAAVAAAANDIVDLIGSYVGAFNAKKFHTGKNPSYSNRINITIEHIGGDKVSGHSVVAGSVRPFSGTYSMDGDKYKIEVAEPGDDKYDGKFSFVLDPSKKTATGTWVANDGKLAVYEREYELERRDFKYDANLELPEDVEYQYLFSNQDEFESEGMGEHLTNDVLKFNASKVKLKKEDVENMYKGDLEIIRNSIYARHGYSFKTRKMRYVFDSAVDWYVPMSTDVSKELTKLEQENIELLKRYEQHAESYYDSFGR